MKPLTEPQIRTLVDVALNDLIHAVQDAIDVDSGDEAAYYFSGEWGRYVTTVATIVSGYQSHELNAKLQLDRDDWVTGNVPVSTIKLIFDQYVEVGLNAEWSVRARGVGENLFLIDNEDGSVSLAYRDYDVEALCAEVGTYYFPILRTWENVFPSN